MSQNPNNIRLNFPQEHEEIGTDNGDAAYRHCGRKYIFNHSYSVMTFLLYKINRCQVEATFIANRSASTLTS